MNIKPENQEEALIRFFSKMNIEMINQILDDDLTYQDFRKPFFLKLLLVAFDTFKNNGDTELIPKPGKCNNCNLCDTGYSFIGNNTGDFIDLIVKSSDGKIKDLFECTEFLNTDKLSVKRSQIYIDRLTNELLRDDV